MDEALTIEMLRAENERLLAMAEKDPLTGLDNRRTVEAKLSRTMQLGGALFICDIDYFRKINDRFGHLKGDECLQRAASLLMDMMRKQDVVGRIGADEFLIFAYGSQTEKTVDIIRTKIQKCFQSYSLSGEVPLMLTIGAAIYREGDSFATLFGRADRDLLELKTRKQLGKDISEMRANPWIHDMKMIRAELAEQVTTARGAFCQDFESFKMIYRYLERCMRRSEQKACVTLVSLADEDGETCALADLRKNMEILGSVLQRNLRMGDVYTQYSSCQYLVLLTDVDKDTANDIMLRLKNCFADAIGNPEEDQLLLYYCYELEPINTI